MNFVFAGGEVFDGERLCKDDVLVADGKVAQVGPKLAAGGARRIEAAGCVLAPGFTDLHVHLRQPGFAHKETIATGTAAAAAGGFTAVCAMPNLVPVPDSVAHLETQRALIKKDAQVCVLPYGALTQGEEGRQLSDIPALAGRVCGFSDDGRGVQDEALMRRAMEEVARWGGFVAAHCEVERLLAPGAVCVQGDSGFAKARGWVGYSAESEWREVARDIALARQTGCRLHICHASTAESFDLVRRAKAEGLAVSCEATPHNLLLSCDDISEDSGRYRMNPPLRWKKDVIAAQEALRDGTIDAIATDHAPHTEAEKACVFGESVNGVVGLETAFAACYTGLVLPGVIGLARLLALLTTGPEGVLGRTAGPAVEQNRRSKAALGAQNSQALPAVAPGAPANLVLLDLNRRETVNPQTFVSLGRATPFAGAALTGWPVLTLYEGKEVFRRR